jgi:DNA/RNA endonuclease YhcR with UshA esterase domain
MKKVILLLSLVSFISVGAQDAKNDPAGKANAPIRIAASEAKEHIDAQAVVKGKIAEVNVGERVVRLNFDQIYPKNTFTAVIFPANTNKFPEVAKLKGKTVEVSGKIAVYRERPQIVLTNPNQVKVLEETKDAAENK